jgi:hypothetical protein
MHCRESKRVKIVAEGKWQITSVPTATELGVYRSQLSPSPNTASLCLPRVRSEQVWCAGKRAGVLLTISSREWALSRSSTPGNLSHGWARKYRFNRLRPDAYPISHCIGCDRPRTLSRMLDLFPLPSASLSTLDATISKRVALYALVRSARASRDDQECGSFEIAMFGYMRYRLYAFAARRHAAS